jgi:hypothetical protein
MIATTFIFFALCLFTAMHIGRCVSTYRSYRKVFDKEHLSTFFVGVDPTRVRRLQDKNSRKNYFLNNYVEIAVALIGIAAVVTYFLTYIYPW